MTENNYNIHSGEIYLVGKILEDGNIAPITSPQSREADEGIIDLSKSSQHVWGTRYAVVISRDDCNEDGVLMAFLTRNAISKEERLKNWYKRFSPKQVEVKFIGRPTSVLCSHISRVNVNNLVEWMGKVTQDELTCIVKKVQKIGEFDEIIPFLYQPENSPLEK